MLNAAPTVQPTATADYESVLRAVVASDYPPAADWRVVYAEMVFDAAAVLGVSCVGWFRSTERILGSGN